MFFCFWVYIQFCSTHVLQHKYVVWFLILAMATKPMPRVRAGVSGNPVISISGTKRAHTGSTRSNSLSASTQGKTGLSLHSIDDLNTYKEIPKFSETSYLVHSNELDSVALSQKKEFMHHDKNIAVSTRSSPLGQMPSIATPQNNCSKFESGRVMVQSDCNSELETSDAEKLKELMMLQVCKIFYKCYNYVGSMFHCF